MHATNWYKRQPAHELHELERVIPAVSSIHNLCQLRLTDTDGEHLVVTMGRDEYRNLANAMLLCLKNALEGHQD